MGLADVPHLPIPPPPAQTVSRNVFHYTAIVQDCKRADRCSPWFRNPLHPYTKALFSAIPIPDPKVKMNRIVLEGSIPSPANPPKGCKFHTRCANCMACCREEAPVQREIEPGHFVCCHLYDK